MIRFFNTLVCIFVLSFAFAQPGVSPQKTVNGKKFYVHKVEAGNTLYGLQRIYGVSVEEIVQSNGTELNAGLKVGQEVLIPIKETAEVKETLTSPYTVQKEETLYGISRKFNTTVDELIRLNPETESGIKKGQVIRVPGEFVQEIEVIEEETPNPFVVEDQGETKVLFNFNDSIVEHTVLAHETMYSVSKRFMVSIEEIMEFNNLKSTSLSVGQVLRIPIKQERTEKVTIKEVPSVNDPKPKEEVFVKKDRYKIIVMAPFYLDYGKGYSEYVSNMATHFYMGAQMAIDTLRSKGLKADIHFVDTKGDSTAVADLLKSAEFKNVDIIIGPFFPKTQKLVADFCKINKVRMIVPVNLDEKEIEGNAFVYSAVPSDKQLILQTADFLLRTEKKANIVLIQVTKESDKELFESFKSYYNSKVLASGGSVLKESSIDNLKNYIVRGTKTIFVVPTNDKNTGMKFMNSLNRSAFRSTAEAIAVYGTKDWMNFSDVNGTHRDKFNFHFASTTYLNYYDDYTIEANRKFRRKYNTDLSRMAAQGYDIMLYSGMHFLLEKEPKNLLMNRIGFISTGEGNGFVNKEVYMLEQENYEIIDSEALPKNGSK